MQQSGPSGQIGGILNRNPDAFRAWAEIPAEVQATVLTSEAEQFCFLLNFTNESKTVTFNKPNFDLLKEREVRGRAEVPPYGVRFVRL